MSHCHDFPETKTCQKFFLESIKISFFSLQRDHFPLPLWSGCKSETRPLSDSERTVKGNFGFCHYPRTILFAARQSLPYHHLSLPVPAAAAAQGKEMSCCWRRCCCCCSYCLSQIGVRRRRSKVNSGLKKQEQQQKVNVAVQRSVSLSLSPFFLFPVQSCISFLYSCRTMEKKTNH